MIILGLFSLLTVFDLCVPTIGNAILTKSVDENYQEYMKINMMYMWVVSWITVALYCLYQPFMMLWLGNPEFLLPDYMITLFAIYFFTYKWLDVNQFYVEAAGLWYEIRYIPVLAAVVNLIINIILVQIIGLAGIVISTIISLLFVYDIGGVRIVFKAYFKRSPTKFVLRHFYYVVMTLLALIITNSVCGIIAYNGISEIVAKLFICLIVPNIVIMTFLSRFKEFSSVIRLINSFKKRFC